MMSCCILDIHIFPLINNPGLKRITILSLVIVIPFITCLSFNFTNFTSNDANITYEPSAYPSNNVIQLAQFGRNYRGHVGRATYAQPLHLWDRASGNVTDFTTTFSFVISSNYSTSYGDGMAFFLAPNGSRIPANPTNHGGGSLGLMTSGQQFNDSTDNPFVAVEFDIHHNTYDPQSEHVGVNINSIRSVVNETWWCADSIIEGREQETTISYVYGSRKLSVVFTNYRNRTDTRQGLSYTIDLREHLPEFVTFGFSAAMGNVSTLFSIHSWSFSSSTLEVNGYQKDSGNSKNPLIIGSAVGGTVFLVISGLLLYFLIWKKSYRMMDETGESFNFSFGDEFDQGSGPIFFVYNDLKRATNNFSEQGKLGEGGFGGVYRGSLKETDSYIAVKRVSRGSSQGIKEYASEVKIISRLRHRNLVQLLGWCHEKPEELLLVYEFMPNGSLDSHLFKQRSLLNWEIRFKIVQGLASTLLYLHEEWEQCVVHRDIKSSNVMLDANFNAKLGDFGLARLVDHEKGYQTTVLAGTMGYMAPECMTTGKASKETDVYSFGVVALEIASGRRTIDHRVEESRVNLIEWIWSLYGTGTILKASDPQLGVEFDSREIELLLIVGLWCAHPDSNVRPSIRQAIRVLNFEASLPDLTLRMPMPKYWHMLPSLDGTMVYGNFQTFSSLQAQT